MRTLFPLCTEDRRTLGKVSVPQPTASWLRCSSRHVVSKHGSRIVLDSCMYVQYSITAQEQKYIQETETWSINSCHFPIVARLFVCSCPFRKAVYQINARHSVSFHTTPHRYEISPPSPPFNPPSHFLALRMLHSPPPLGIQSGREQGEAGRQGDIQGVDQECCPRSPSLVSSLPGTSRRLIIMFA